ncbi:MAG: M15 family metallopeptidase [Bacteriodetes bacterium]|nr:M15 family metallopeptidase [Bacteroidota bacterium]
MSKKILLPVMCLFLLLLSFINKQPHTNVANIYSKAYPATVVINSDNTVSVNKGRHLQIEPKSTQQDFEQWLNNATLTDQLEQEYTKGSMTVVPAINFDPGRARCEEFFEEMYGHNAGEVIKNCTTIQWVDGTPLVVTKVNGVDKHFRQIVAELKKLPSTFSKYLTKPGGTYNWRNIAGTNRRSTHSYGIAIDINVGQSHYWRNSTADKKGVYPYKNKIPMEIVNIFEKHGFIWGGKWYHYDTMHFEYRPELCSTECSCN